MSLEQSTYVRKIIGQAKSKTLQQEWKANDYSDLTFLLKLDNYSLLQIEKIRNGSDLQLIFDMKFQAWGVDDPTTMMSQYSSHIEEQIPKSKWIETILTKLNYKNVALIELPQLQYPELNRAIDMLNLAWKGYSRGDMDDVLLKCRKAIEEVTTRVKKAGFKKRSLDKDGKPTGRDMVPDWEKFFDSENKGDIIGTILKKAYGFTGSGAHTGSILDANHAYFILLQAFSLTHLVISRFNLMNNESYCT